MNALCNLDGLRTAGTHLYTLSSFFIHFDYEFLLLVIKAFSVNSVFLISCCCLV